MSLENPQEDAQNHGEQPGGRDEHHPRPVKLRAALLLALFLHKSPSMAGVIDDFSCRSGDDGLNNRKQARQQGARSGGEE